MRFVLRSGRAGGEAFVEAINLGGSSRKIGSPIGPAAGRHL